METKENLEKKILAKIAELSETEIVKQDTPVTAFETWDSLAMISFIVFANSDLHVQFENVELIRNAKTAGELCALLIERMK